MSGNGFLDTNILIYAHTDLDIEKQKIAQDLIVSEPTIISLQVINEIANTLSRKFKMNWDDVSIILKEVSNNSELYENRLTTIQQACRIANRFQFGFYDSLIISAAIEAECSVLYSEDLHHGQEIMGLVRIQNPFQTKST